MARGRVICDSEDEDGGDFSDLEGAHSPDRIDALAPVPPVVGVGGDKFERPPPEDPNSDARSTDPDFFRRIYEEQQNAINTTATAAVDATTSFIPDTFRDIREPECETGASLAAAKQKSSSSLTDPTTTTAMSKNNKNRKTKKRSEPIDLAEMTQVTTPDAPATKRKDIYDFDVTEEESAGLSVPRSRFKAPKLEASRKAKGPDKHKKPAAHSSPPRPAARAEDSSANDPINLGGESDDSSPPRPTRKKRKSGGGQEHTVREGSEDVDLLVMPTTENGSLDSIVHDNFEPRPGQGDPVSTSSLVIVPSSLTASQKQQYMRVSGSFELGPDKCGPDDDDQEQASLPPPKQTQVGSTNKSESTILYTTPSRYCSSLAPLADSKEQSDPNVSDPSFGKTTQLDAFQPGYSPDELSAHPVEIMSRAKKRKKSPGQEDELAQDDGWNSDHIGFSRDNYQPRPSKRRSRAVVEQETDEQSMPDTCPPGVEDFEATEPAPEAVTAETHAIEGLDPDFLAAMPDDIRQEIINNHISAANTQTARTRSRARPSEASSGSLLPNEEVPQPKKRGRKKKVPSASDEVPVAAVADDEVGAQPSPAPVASAKKKRGRPRKSGSDPAPAADESEPQPSIEDAPATPQATKATGKRGRKKKMVEEAPPQPVEEDPQEFVDESEKAPEQDSRRDGGDGTENSGREALRDISNTAAEKTLVDEHKNESKAASTAAGGQADKVRYRVGLSKRSRIAPLLKMIRK